MTAALSHPSWCAGGHRCTAPDGEHRSEPISLARVGQRLSVVVTLVRRADRTHAEVRLSYRLAHADETAQVRELWRLLRRLSHITREDIRR